MHPILFHIGPAPIRAYGVMVLVAFLVAVNYGMRQARRRIAAGDKRITPDQVFDMGLMSLFVGILGARVVYVALNWSQFSEHPLDALKIWTGGLTVIGSMLTGIPWLAYYCRKHKVPFLAFADLVAPAFFIGYAIGRIGCFLNGCCYGSACSLPWAVQFPVEGQPGVLTPPSHPSQLYASLVGLCAFAFLHFRSKKPHVEGEMFHAFVVIYCLYRFVDEGFRKGVTAKVLVGGLTYAQVFLLVVLPVALWSWRRLRRRARSASSSLGSSG